MVSPALYVLVSAGALLLFMWAVLGTSSNGVLAHRTCFLLSGNYGGADDAFITKLQNNGIAPGPSDSLCKRVSADSILAAVQQAYDRGARVFIGTLSSTELKAITPFAAQHGDSVAFVSTSSTAPSLAVNVNLFRLASSDAAMVTWFVSHALPNYLSNIKRIVTYTQPGDVWALEFTDLIHRAARDVRVESSTAAGLTEVNTSGDVLNWIVFTDVSAAYRLIQPYGSVRGAQFMLSDTCFFAKAPAGYTLPTATVYALSSFHAKDTVAAWPAQLPPFVTNLETACMVASVAARHGEPARAVRDAFGPTGTHMLDANGDASTSDFGLAVLDAAGWTLMVQAGAHVRLGQFTTKYLPPVSIGTEEQSFNN